MGNKIGLLGHKGFVGSAISRKLKTFNYDYVGINRENYSEFSKENFDIIINSAMPSKRFWALNNPLEDFKATVMLTADIVFNWKWNKIIQISTVSARCQLNHPYGLNKKCAESFVQNTSEKNLIVRLGAMYGKGLDKGAVFDILNGNKVFLSGNSKYNFIDVDEVAKFIIRSIDKTGIIDIGAKDQLSLFEIANYFEISACFEGRTESQNTLNPSQDFPSAKNIIKHLEGIKNQLIKSSNDLVK